jgi:methionyl-tRNA formyltransferase
MTMKLIFAGSSEFAVPSLFALLDAGHEIGAVLTQPDRPAGRKRRLTPTPVRVAAEERGLTVMTPATLRDEPVVDALRSVGADAMVVVDYGLMIPAEVLGLPRHGCINGHASLLPRWRGAAPIERAILAGDIETGISVMQMDEGLDTGGVLLTRTTPIAETDTAGALRGRLSVLCAESLVEALAGIETGGLTPVAQPATGACYAKKLRSDEARIDWSQPAPGIVRHVNAFNPRPGAWTVFRGQRLKILEAAASDVPAPAGTPAGQVVAASAGDGIVVATGAGGLALTALQLPGKRVTSAAEFRNGHDVLDVLLGEETDNS